jgi:translation initiation factor IF-3
VKFRPGTDEGDYRIKLRNLIKFLEDGDKTKVTLRFRGREMAHQEFGVRLLQRVRSDLELHGVVEQFPRLEGRQMVMVLSPLKKEQRDKIKREAAKKPATPAHEAAKKPVAIKRAAKPAVKPAMKPEATT